MEVHKQERRIILDDHEKHQVLQTGAMKCPECKQSMTFFPTERCNKPEISCLECKLSAPLW